MFNFEETDLNFGKCWYFDILVLVRKYGTPGILFPTSAGINFQTWVARQNSEPYTVWQYDMPGCGTCHMLVQSQGEVPLLVRIFWRPGHPWRSRVFFCYDELHSVWVPVLTPADKHESTLECSPSGQQSPPGWYEICTYGEHPKVHHLSLGNLSGDFFYIEFLITLLKHIFVRLEKDHWNHHCKELLQDAKMCLWLVCRIFMSGLTVGSGAVLFFSGCTSKW